MNMSYIRQDKWWTFTVINHNLLSILLLIKYFFYSFVSLGLIYLININFCSFGFISANYGLFCVMPFSCTVCGLSPESQILLTYSSYLYACYIYF